MYGQPISQGNSGHYGFDLMVAVGSAGSYPKRQVDLGWGYHANATVGQSTHPGLTSQPLLHPRSSGLHRQLSRDFFSGLRQCYPRLRLYSYQNN